MKEKDYAVITEEITSEWNYTPEGTLAIAVDRIFHRSGKVSYTFRVEFGKPGDVQSIEVPGIGRRQLEGIASMLQQGADMFWEGDTDDTGVCSHDVPLDRTYTFCDSLSEAFKPK